MYVSIINKIAVCRNCKNGIFTYLKVFNMRQYHCKSSHMREFIRTFVLPKNRFEIKLIYPFSFQSSLYSSRLPMGCLDVSEQLELEVNWRSKSMVNFQQTLQRNCDDEITFSHFEWKDFEMQACTEDPLMKKQWESACMKLMYTYGYCNLSESFYDYLNLECRNPNLSSLCLFMAIQGKYGSKDKIHKEKVVLEMYEKVSQKHHILDPVSGFYVIVGLTHTSQWKLALPILDSIKLTVTVGSEYYSLVISAAIREKDFNMAFKFIDILVQRGLNPKDSVLNEILLLCEDSINDSLLERYFKYCSQYNWFPLPKMAKRIEEVFASVRHGNWTCEWTTVNTVRGRCNACGQLMDRIDLNDSEFDALQKAFIEKTLIGQNVYIKTHPLELRRFRKFLEVNAPFDIVVDVLNICTNHRKLNKAEHLTSVVDYFSVKKGMRTLFIGRSYMQKWNSLTMDLISRHAAVFLSDNKSLDDPFGLYAAVFSGKKCFYMSKDYMRDHKHLLGHELGNHFYHWQRSRQIFNFSIGSKLGEIFVQT